MNRTQRRGTIAAVWGAHAPSRAGDAALVIANFPKTGFPRKTPVSCPGVTLLRRGRRNQHARARALPRELATLCLISILHYTSAAALCLLAGCSGGPSVNLTTAEPIKVDINMKLDVYQHGDKTPKVPAAVTKAVTDEVAVRRRYRMGELQLLKDARLIGENHLGLLTVRNAPPGEYGQYVQRTVDAENSDREAEMQRLAKERHISVEELRKEQAKLTSANAFTGEWIEVPQSDGSFAWIQKGS